MTMNTPAKLNPTMEQMKRNARRMTKDPAMPNMTHCQALDILAKQQGHSTWAALVASRTERRHDPNIHRLRLLHQMLQTIPDERIDLRSWRARSTDQYFNRVSDSELAKLECGTTACAVGWACMYPPLMAEGLYWGVERQDVSTRGMPYYGDHCSFAAVQEFFGIPHSMFNHLFVDAEPRTTAERRMSVRQRVMHRIVQLLDKHGAAL